MQQSERVRFSWPSSVLGGVHTYVHRTRQGPGYLAALFVDFFVSGAERDQKLGFLGVTWSLSITLLFPSNAVRTQQLCKQTHMYILPLWASLGLSVRLCASLRLSGLLWASLGLSGPLWASPGLSEPLWASLGLSGPLYIDEIKKTKQYIHMYICAYIHT